MSVGYIVVHSLLGRLWLRQFRCGLLEWVGRVTTWLRAVQFLRRLRPDTAAWTS